MSDLPKRLRIKASMIAWGSDTALMEEAADVIEALSASIKNHQMHMLGLAYDRDQLRAMLSAQSAPEGWRELLRRARKFVEDWDDDSQEFMDLCGEIDNALAASTGQETANHEQ